MLATLAKSIFGSSNDRYVAKLGRIVETINGYEPTISAMTDDELRGQTALFRQRLAEGTKLDDLLPEAFATVREAAIRTLGQRHYDVQMVGGIALHRGEIAEMRTGEGKTLVATLAVYLNALPGKGVHVVTVNDYLAKRDADWMGQIYRFLGLDGGRDRAQPQRYRAARGLSGRHHLRDQQRARLRLPPRQYEILARPDGPAAVHLRDRRRGGLDPDRRGAHAADHFRPDRRQVGALHGRRRDREAVRRERLREGREAEEHRPDRGRHRKGRADARGRRADRGHQPLRHRQYPGRPSPEPGPEGQQDVQAGHRLYREGREDRHHRRVHRPDDGRAALVGRASPGGRGQGRRPDRAGEPDARLDHLPELFPHVSQAGGHDRHGADRSAGVLRHLPDERRVDPDQRAGPAERRGRRVLQEHHRQVRAPSPRRSRRGRKPASRSWSAPCRSKNRRCCRNISSRKASRTRS